MGERCRIEPFLDYYGNIAGDCEQNVCDDVHGAEVSCGDAATLCGIPFVDEGNPIETKEALTCIACINVLESRAIYKKHKNGKWY